MALPLPPFAVSLHSGLLHCGFPHFGLPLSTNYQIVMRTEPPPCLGCLRLFVCLFVCLCVCVCCVQCPRIRGHCLPKGIVFGHDESRRLSTQDFPIGVYAPLATVHFFQCSFSTLPLDLFSGIFRCRVFGQAISFFRRDTF